MQIYLDGDGVCFDYMKGLGGFVQRHTSYKPTSVYPRTYDLSCWLPDVSRDEIRGLIAAFNGTRGSGFEALEPYRDAVSALTQLKADGHTIKMVTKASKTGPAAESRLENTETLFPGIFSDVVLLDFTDSKLETLQGMEPGIWVDDLAIHVREGIQAGHQSHLLTHAYNESDKDLDHTRILCLSEIPGVILTLDKSDFYQGGPTNSCVF